MQFFNSSSDEDVLEPLSDARKVPAAVFCSNDERRYINQYIIIHRMCFI